MGSRPRWARTSHTRSFFLRLADPSVSYQTIGNAFGSLAATPR